jgi:RHS repeat-associated protein
MMRKMHDNIRLYHVDHLGSTSLVTDAEGLITQHVAYIPYGEIFVEQRNGSWNTPYLFNAKELDEETGLYYYGARYLDPTNATWLSVDPLFEKYVGMTPYNYCAGNPVKLVDVDGRDAEITINWEKGTISVNANIYLYGDGATKQVAQAYKDCIMNSWGALNEYEYKDKTFTVTWNINVELAKNGEPMVFDGVNNYIECKKDIAFSTTEMNKGTWRSRNSNGGLLTSEGDNPAIHEFGHILGLRDRYITRSEAKRTNLSYKTIFEGWEGNVMAEPAGKGVVETKNLDILFSPALETHKFMIDAFEKEFPSSPRRFPYDNKSYKINKDHREPILKTQLKSTSK